MPEFYEIVHARIEEEMIPRRPALEGGEDLARHRGEVAVT